MRCKRASLTLTKINSCTDIRKNLLISITKVSAKIGIIISKCLMFKPSYAHFSLSHISIRSRAASQCQGYQTTVVIGIVTWYITPLRWDITPANAKPWDIPNRCIENPNREAGSRLEYGITIYAYMASLENTNWYTNHLKIYWFESREMKTGGLLGDEQMCLID